MRGGDQLTHAQIRIRHVGDESGFLFTPVTRAVRGTGELRVVWVEGGVGDKIVKCMWDRCRWCYPLFIIFIFYSTSIGLGYILLSIRE